MEKVLWCLLLLIAAEMKAQIPTIVISTDEEIVDEPKVPAILTYTDDEGQVLTSNIGIEIRGGFSQTYPKKTYDIEFWEDPTGTETQDVQFGDLREDDDWVLDAMYNEPLRVNSFMTHKLWLEMNQVYYQELEPNAKSGADVMYVEMSINGDYQGIYMLSEQIDRSLLKLRRNVDTDIRGALYKGYKWDDAVLFNDPDELPNNSSNTWSGFEYRYPKDVINWGELEDLVKFVANSSDDEFVNEIEERFDFNNLVDYFIFLNVARILDNRGKNIYLSRYDADEPYFMTPWDLDGSWGLLWDGSNDTTTKGILSNNLYDRIIATDAGGFRQWSSDRWSLLRDGLLDAENLKVRFATMVQFLKDNDIYSKEEDAWDYEFSDQDLSYFYSWLDDRLEFLDDYFRDITSVEVEINTQEIKVFPNPVGDQLFVKGDFSYEEALTIYNIYGQEIYDGTFSGSHDGIDVNFLIPGIYYLKIGSKQASFVKY